MFKDLAAVNSEVAPLIPRWEAFKLSVLLLTKYIKPPSSASMDYYMRGLLRLARELVAFQVDRCLLPGGTFTEPATAYIRHQRELSPWLKEMVTALATSEFTACRTQLYQGLTILAPAASSYMQADVLLLQDFSADLENALMAECWGDGSLTEKCLSAYLDKEQAQHQGEHLRLALKGTF
jgi:hypothetical protein